MKGIILDLVIIWLLLGEYFQDVCVALVGDGDECVC